MAKGPPVVGVNPENTIRANAAMIIPVRIAELLQWERFIDDPKRVAELHAMRISAKRLRYTMELFAPFYDAAFAAAIDKVKGIQEQLGSIHDADVLVPELLGQLRRMLPKEGSEKAAEGVYAIDIDASVGLLTLCRRKREEREAMYRKFISGWRRLRGDGFFETLREMVREETSGQAGAGSRDDGVNRDRSRPSSSRQPGDRQPVPIRRKEEGHIP